MALSACLFAWTFQATGSLRAAAAAADRDAEAAIVEAAAESATAKSAAAAFTAAVFDIRAFLATLPSHDVSPKPD